MTLGFLEVPGNVVQESRTNGVFSGITVGLAMGVGKLVARELVGVYELVTAPFPVPAGFEPVLQPESPGTTSSPSPAAPTASATATCRRRPTSSTASRAP